ncbi:cutinase family protein [Microbacterium sp. SSW1-49]|uniref:Cutinase family protein n=2 Tax=Microbacterium croceum TaxID=2851645 RepID=A0ABT0FB75_9MICO|nr:cutinase family protein [Microbacterium croceum]
MTMSVGVTVSAAGPAAASNASSPCNFAVLIAVRGSGEPAGSGLAHSGRVWTSGGMGGQISVLANKMKAEAFPTYFESLNYPATVANYQGSVSAGAATLINELNWLATACGNYLPAVVIAGHSQGAHVISDALGGGLWPNGPSLSTKAKQMVRAVTFFGDPQYWPTEAWNAPYSPSGYGVFTRNVLVRNDLSTYRYWGWTQGSTSPSPSWNSKIRSYCATGDYFCQKNPADKNFTIHNSYRTTTMTIANNWIRYVLTSAG